MTRPLFRGLGSRSQTLLLGIALVGAGLRLYACGRHGLWQDEIASVLIVDDMRTVANPLVGHAPLYYTLLHLWLAFGRSEAWIRGLGVLVGTLVILGVYRVAREEFDERTALIAAWFTALSPVQVWASREARPYIVLHLLLLIAFWSWGRAQASGRPRFWLAFAVAAAASMYTHYYAALILATLGLLTLAPAERPLLQRLVPFVLASLLAMALFLPWARILQGGQQGLAGYAAEVRAYSNRNTFPLKTLAYLLGRSDPPHLLGAAAESVLPGRSFTWLSLAALLAIAAPAYHRARQQGKLAALRAWASLALLPTLMAVALNEWRNFFLSPRYVASNSIFLALPAALAVQTLPRVAQNTLLASALGLSLLGVRPLYEKPTSEIREGVYYIDERASPGDCVGVISNKAFCYRYYSRHPLPVFDLPWEVPSIARHVDASTPLSARVIRQEDLPAILSELRSCRTAWILYNEEVVWGVDMGGGLLRSALVDGGFALVDERRFSDTRVEAYRSAPH